MPEPIGNQKSIESHLVDAIIKAKKKESKAEKEVVQAGIAILLTLAASIVYLYLRWNANPFVSQLIADPVVLFFMLVTGLTFVRLNHKKYSYEKAEGDYERLKEDLIDRSSEIWSSRNEQTKTYEQLKKDHDINLFHK